VKIARLPWDHRWVNGRDDSVDSGEELLGRPTPSRHRRLALGLAALLVVGGVTAGLVTRASSGSQQGRPAPGSETTRVRSAVPTAAPSTVPSGVVAGPVVRTAALPDVGPVQLFARAAEAVVQIDFAADRVITTAMPALRSSGPVTFGATATGAYVRPFDAVPGYFVPDGAPARDLTGELASAAVLPGPDSESVWVEESTGDTLLGFRAVYVPTAAVTSSFLPVPAAVGRIGAPAQSDGSGYLLINGAGGTFDLRPDGAHRLPEVLRHATILASGDGRLLVASCPSPQLQRCPISLVRLPDGRLSRIGRAPAVAGMLPGVIAPDGRTAAVYQPAGAGRLAARVLDLETGRFRGAAVPVGSGVQPGSAVYSSDGRWLFLVGTHGKLIAVNARTGEARGIDAGLPTVYQLAVRG
jgi:hypothetical protein